jgi:integrase
MSRSVALVACGASAPAPRGLPDQSAGRGRLAAILAGDDPLVNVEPSHVTFKQACQERLRYLEHDQQRKRSTINDYRNVIAHDLLPRFGQSTPVEAITTQDVDAFKDELLERVSHRTAHKILMVLHGVMSRAKRKTWIATNPARTRRRSRSGAPTSSNVLSVEQVHAVAREVATKPLRAMFVTAAFTGLRMRELLALRWRHIDFANRILHVQRNYVEGG